jgi:predicted permease
MALISVGLRARLPDRDAPVAPVAIGLAARLIVAPALVLAAGHLAGGTGVSWSVSVLQAGMPPMVTAGIIATQAGLDARAATLAVSGGLVASLVTLPLLAAAIPWT